MELKEGIKTRRSIRKFSEKEISKEVIQDIIEVCRFSPSWKNTQTPEYYVVMDHQFKKKIAEEGTAGFAKNKDTIQGANALVILVYTTGKSGCGPDGTYITLKGHGWEMFDAGIAAQTFCLAAHEKGIGSVILGIFDEEIIASMINLPENMKVAALIPIGFPDTTPEAPKKKEVSQLLRFL